MRKWTVALPTLGAFAASAALFGQMPAEGTLDLSSLLPAGIPASGEPMSREAAALLLPAIALAVWLLFMILEKVRGPAKPLPQWLLNEQTGAAGVGRFEPTYNSIVFAVTALLALTHVLILGSFLGWPRWSYQAFTAILGAGMVAAGNVMPRVRPNWIVGLRTRRTLADPLVWSRTHRLLGMLLIAAGSLVVLASFIAPRYALLAGVVALLLALFLSHLFGTRSTRLLPVDASTSEPR